MAAKWIEKKTRYRQYKARMHRLPGNCRMAIDALKHYSHYRGGGLSMLEDLVGLFEQGAANRTPIREIVGEDPVEFAETFIRNHSKGSTQSYPEGSTRNYAEGSRRNHPGSSWIRRKQRQLAFAVDLAARQDTGNEGISR